MKMFIKPFNELSVQELYGILRLRSDVFVMEQQCIYQDCDNKDLDAVQLFYVDKGEIVAGVRLLKRGVSYDEVSIGRVVTNPTYRHLGIGRQMMLQAIEYIEKEWHETEIRISAQQYLVAFYESVGFKVVSDVYLEDDLPHIEMLYQKKT